MVIRLAGKVIQVNHLYPYIVEYCREYLYEEDAEQIDFTVNISEEDIVFERKKSEREDIKEGHPIRQFSDEYLETLAVYRKIAEHLLEYDTILFHGSVIAVDGEGYLFTAKSGTGKSTHTALWRDLWKDRAVMVNDDKPLLSISETGVIAYGTPWNGKHRLSTNIAVPLKSICILQRDTVNHIEPAEKKAVYPLIIQQTNKPAAPVQMMKTLQLIDKMLANVAVYTLGCNMDPDAARVSYEGMQTKAGTDL